ncbi:membrane-bound transcription factor site-2 protease-like [Glandiceps talaboti]
MMQTTWVALLLGFWSALYLLDIFLRSYRKCARRYLDFEESYGVTVGIGQVRWYSTCLNRAFIKIGQSNQVLLQGWFTLGIWFGLVAMVSSIAVLIYMLAKTFLQESPAQQVLTPVMPGVNLPMSQMFYYFLTLVVCGVLHEFGHAIAAVREQVRVNGFGVFLFLIYPGAYVDLYTDHLHAISPLRQLRIYCAGVWHNFIIVIVGIFILTYLPIILLPFYTTGYGAIVTRVTENSPVYGDRGLSRGFKLLNMNGCSINYIEDWATCIQDVIHQPTKGYCMSADEIQNLNTAKSVIKAPDGSMQCCSNTSLSDLCFIYSSKELTDKKYACIAARPVTDRLSCKTFRDCLVFRDMRCLYPSLPNNTYLVRVIHDSGPALLYVGDPYLLLYTVSISGYVPKYNFLPLDLPNMVETLCKYMISLSGALAMLNSVPCYALDGQWILTAFIEHIFQKSIRKIEDRHFLTNCILLVGTFVLVANILLAMWTFFR